MDKVRKSVRRTSRATTIDEVAALAKVSPMTVSRVVNNTGGVRDATRERVMRAVDKLGYTPNLAASALAAAQSTRIALIYSDPSGAYLRELLLGVLRVASRTPIQLVIDCWDDLDADAERKAARKLAKGVAGVILPPPLCESKAAVLELVRAKVPVVAIASNYFSPDVACVRIDEFTAAKEITEHLIAQGHTRIGYIAGHPNLSASTRRFEGFQAALEDAGLRLDLHLVQPGDYTYKSGLVAAEKLLARKCRPSAIFASNDDMAAAAISVAHRRGLDVPRDLSVVGFDDTSAATAVWPEITTVQQPIAAMADAALDILLKTIRAKERTAKMVDHVVAHLLVKRDSVAAPTADDAVE
ncbi:LacI family DNA-binding transcriptional regulator [Xanthomonas oryzae pv. oryzae]|uniref:LacI family transcriptional regulator n=1 Tax=Xanthomonas oryzae pv. oryzae TaxID=64187 RepID=A0A854CL98_XANOO|nr:LacI family DNA-binding transcriptional regulator [Xanthomonas oryzae]AJQ81530.1 LacI family transcription regulator [Xanthomonas oryzae pv. oryzae PXO86]BAE70916.1 sal operon transcriptional repressor [Xanthomonas oryzae pv. oryzae MAFF 311018]ALZ70410.1 LacI family transcriptional regulator [Xanthomonas oryzae pv. oryzae]AOS04250.1 LacI family transcriptional regulator [Xanthomonas oryzae pv. oryzae]AOS05081.1 LacI family transcriptional regulator [Xanthomonas oryzae pv. oryzae]